MQHPMTAFAQSDTIIGIKPEIGMVRGVLDVVRLAPLPSAAIGANFVPANDKHPPEPVSTGTPPV